MQGLSGSGKTTAGKKLAQQLDGVMLRADVERKRLFGLAPLAQSHQQDCSIYTREVTAKTFQNLLRKTETLLSQDHAVIVDSAFLRKSERDMFRKLADITNIPFVIVKCLAPEEIMEQRIIQRLDSGADASEATVEVLEQQKGWEESLTAAELERAILLETDQEDWESRLFFALPSIV